jgi:hypothetical protein
MVSHRCGRAELQHHCYYNTANGYSAPNINTTRIQNRATGAGALVSNHRLLNKFLKEHCKVEELETTVAQQRSASF